jgi:CpXC protein
MAQVFRFGYFGQVGHRVYTGASARTRKGQVIFSCPCGERFRAEVWLAVDTNDAAAVDKLMNGTLNRARCPACAAVSEVHVPVLFHDLVGPRLLLVLPDSLRHRELAERARLFAELAEDLEPPPLYVLEPDVVFGAAGLRASLAPPPSSGDFAAATPALTPTPTPTPPLSQPLSQVSAKHPPLGGDVESTPVSEVGTRLRVNVPDPRQTVIDRWIASREGPATFLVDDEVLACASLTGDSLEPFIAGPLELRVQLHRLPNYPVVALTFVAGKGVGEPDTERVLCIPLDVARAAHRVVLESLGRKSRLTLELYDPEYLPVVAHEVSAPVEENVRRVIAEAKDALERLAPATRSFERARGQLLAPRYDRLGRTDVDLPTDLETLEMPSAIRASLAQVARWSEPSAEAYLMEIRALPLGQWRALRARVIRRALDAGIAVPKPLVERSAKEHMAPLPSWPELLEIGIKRFAEVAARQRPNDLTAAEEAENWDQLLRECTLAGVVLDDTVRSLAQAAAKRSRAANAGAGVDLRSLGDDELAALLERKELRREATLILCERHDPGTLEAVFGAVRRMARAEANVVIPALTAYGPVAERWLIEGLASKKSFLRQGCALALGALKTPKGIEALVELLVDEPTEIWGEIARALGDAGPMAVIPLAVSLRGADADRRDRIIHAMAHIAARPESQSRSPVEMLAEGRDALVSAAAQKALEKMEDVRRDDQVVRKSAGTAEVTVVRGFSRRFYDALTGDIELEPNDLEEVSDEEDDAPILDEAPPERVDTGEVIIMDAPDGSEDEDLRTATDLPALATQKLPTKTPPASESTTAPHPRTTLPRDR